MLEQMRGSIGSVFIKVLFGLLILSFMAWGIGDILNPTTSGQGVAEVGEREISQQELAIAYNRQAGYLRQRGLQPEMIAQLGLTNQVVNDLVNRALFEAESDEMGMGVSDQAVVAEIRSQQAFQDSLGQFDRARFEMALQQIGYNEAYYINALKREIATSQLVDSLAGGAYAPDSLTTELYNWREEARSADIMAYTIDSNLQVAQPSDTDVQAHYDVAKETFRAPELRDFTYVVISPEALAESIDVSEEDIQLSYEDRKNEFSTPERRHLQQMLLPDLEAAQQAAELLAAGGDFAEVAKEVADIDESTMDLGFLSKETVPDDQLAEVAFSLALNEPSAPTEGLFGYFIVRTIDIQEGSVSALSEIQDQLKRDIALERATDMVFDMSNELDDALAGGSTIEEAAAQMGLPSVEIKNIDARGYIDSNEAAENIPLDVKFMRIVFETEDATDSLVEELDDGSYFALRIDGITESRIRDMNDVKQDIIDILIADRQQSATEALVKEVIERLNNGEDLNTLGAELGFDVRHVSNVKRDGEDALNLNKLSPVTIAKLFSMEIGKSDYANTGNEFVILSGLSQKNANADADKQGFEAIQSQLAVAISGDILEQFNNALKDRHDVSINRFVINEFESNLNSAYGH